jgi:N-methylhydantoinase A/oxoprolinase/acetone carboxylase beta subunit
MTTAPQPLPTTLHLGIDTGGTFTDGVLLDPATRQVVKKAKVLTTHQDLRICIANILDALLSDNNIPVSLVSLSTTLATNSIAEGKSRPVALFLLGYDPSLVYKFQFDRQFGGSPFFFITGRHDLNGRELEALDLPKLEACLGSLDGQAEAVAISSLVGMRNPAHEEAAAALASRLTRLPVVQGHQLSDHLDSIRRATTARLNASLLSTAYGFMQTVQAMLVEKGIHCPLYVVKGDGSLANAAYAARRPVEMIHSGPATSAIGGSYLAGTQSALVIDVGGTTTDLALTGPSGALAGEGEATVGEYRTALRTIRAHSFGLGGDSLIRFEPHGRLRVGPERVLPLAFLAQHYPEARRDLLEWLSEPPVIWYSDRIEYWLLRRRPAHPPADERARQALALLEKGPVRARMLLKQVGAVSPVQIGADQLIRQDIISVAGLTPTDLMHASGEFAPWDAEAACQAVAAAAAQWEITPQAFIQKVRNSITRRITAEIIQFLSGASLPDKDFGFARKDLAHFAFDENIAPADPFLGVQFQLKLPIVGIGAPARAILPPVAQALHTEIFFPEHYEVANAVGTVVGNILVTLEGEVLPWVENHAVLGHIARAGGVQRTFNKQEEALAHARQVLTEQSMKDACASGAAAPTFDLEERELSDGTIRLTARAAGKPA